MKRIIFLPIILLLLCGCSNVEKGKPIVNNISFIAEIDCDDFHYVCNVDALKDSLYLAVTQPTEIQGFTLKRNKNQITVEFGDVIDTVELNRLPNNSIIRILIEIFDDVEDKSIKFDQQNGVACGNISGYKYEFVFSPSGLPLTMKVDELNFELFFNNVMIK